MKRIIIPRLLLASPVFAEDFDDPSRKLIQAIKLEDVKEIYANNLRSMGCKVDFNDDVARIKLFDLFVADVYALAKIPAESRTNHWVEGDALAQKDEAFFHLEADGLASFESAKKVMSLHNCP